MGEFIRAVAFAAEKHRDQRRKDAHASPYINHPLALANVLANEGGIADINVLCAAVLHDTVEDTNTTFEEIDKEFGPSIAALVREMTDDKSLPKQTRKQLQIDHAHQASANAKLIKLADKICNLRDILRSPPAEWDHNRKIEYFSWAENVVAGLRGTHPDLEAEFDAVLALRSELT